MKFGGRAWGSPSEAHCFRDCLENSGTQRQQVYIRTGLHAKGGECDTSSLGVHRVSENVHIHLPLVKFARANTDKAAGPPSAHVSLRPQPRASCPLGKLTEECLLWPRRPAPVGTNQKHSGRAAKGRGVSLESPVALGATAGTDPRGVSLGPPGFPGGCFAGGQFRRCFKTLCVPDSGASPGPGRIGHGPWEVFLG